MTTQWTLDQLTELIESKQRVWRNVADTLEATGASRFVVARPRDMADGLDALLDDLNEWEG